MKAISNSKKCENREVGGHRIEEVFGEVLVEMLKGHCGMNKQEKQAQKRGKKIIAGKEIRQSDLINNDKTLPGTSKVLPVPVLAPVPAKRRKVQEVEPSSDSESGGSVSYQDSSTGSTTRTSYGLAGADSESPVVSRKSQYRYEPDQWIVVKYEGRKVI